MNHPRNVMISLRLLLESIFRIEVVSGRLIGSNAPAKGLKIMNRGIATSWPALETILQLVGESSTAVTPS